MTDSSETSKPQAADENSAVVSRDSGLQTWTTPLGETLTVGGRGGPWVTISPHAGAQPRPETPLKIPLPPGVDADWYYRNGRKLP